MFHHLVIQQLSAFVQLPGGTNLAVIIKDRKALVRIEGILRTLALFKREVCVINNILRPF